MKRKERVLHRNSDNINCRKYGEEYIKYFYCPKEPTSIRSNNIFIDSNISNVLENEIVDREIILSNFLNLGRSIYKSYLHKDIFNSNYLYKREVIQDLKADSFEEFIMFEIMKHKEIKNLVIEWFNTNPFYGKIVKDENNEWYAIPIKLAIFVNLAVSSYMLYRLYNLAYAKELEEDGTYQFCLLSIFSDYIKQTANTKATYNDAIKNMKPDMIKKYCISVLNQLNSKYNPTKFSISIFKDNSIVKIHNSLLSVAFETLIAIICCNSKSICICSNCGNYYSGHASSNLCEPCRIWKDNHKHTKKART